MALDSWSGSDMSAAFAIGDSIIPAESIERTPELLGSVARVMSGTATTAVTAERGRSLGWSVRTALLPIADIETIEGLVEAAGTVTLNGTDFATDTDAHVMSCERDESTDAYEHARLLIELQEVDPL